MNIRAQASADLRLILEDTDNGFATDIKITDPIGTVAFLKGIYRDTNLAIDPQTGMQVNSNTASIVIPKRALIEAAMGEIRNIPDGSSAPYVIELTDLMGANRCFKVTDIDTDELGAVVCMLENYRLI